MTEYASHSPITRVRHAFERTIENSPGASAGYIVGNVLGELDSSTRIEVARAVLLSLGASGDLSTDQVERIKTAINGG